MNYNDHWSDVQSRMYGYWEREAMDRCCIAMTVKKRDYQDRASNHFYYDTVKATEVWQQRFDNNTYYAEAIPCLFPYFGTGGIAEYTGCKSNQLPHTAWFEPWMTDDEPDASLISFRHPEIFQRQKDAVAQLISQSKGEYFVSVTDNCGIMDALAAIRGTDALMMDMLTDPEFVEESVRRLLPIYKQTQTELFDLVKDNNDGSIHSWMHLWAPQRLAQMQCDLSVMISSEMFNRFVMPELEELCQFLDYPVYHLDGQEQIRHLDSLLSLKNLRAIQWTHVQSQPPTRDFVPVFQKIQKAGKNLVLKLHKQDVLPVLDQLSCRGLQIHVVGVDTDEEAMDLLKQIEKHSKDRTF